MEQPIGFHDLLARARDGDRAATDELLALIRPWLEQLANQAQPKALDRSVSDLVQEAWLRAWQKLDQFHGTDDEAQSLAMFRAWLGRIVSRLGLNIARDQSAGQRTPPGKLIRLDGPGPTASGDSAAVLDPSAAEPTPSANVQADEQVHRVQDALARIADPIDREIVRLRFFEGMSLRQVARHLGSNPETVRQRYHAVVGRLQEELRNLQ
jgi:RNA polymerase sigma factor (sigma-70 family)